MQHESTVNLSNAEAYLNAGLCVLPALRQGDEKRVALSSWKQYQQRLPTADEIGAWFNHGSTRGNAVCIVCGSVSGNLEMIDFDLAGEAFDPWRRKVEETLPGLFDRLVVESTPSGGRHVVYRCETHITGNTKLAQRRIEADGAEPIVVADKTHTPRQDADGKWHVVVTMIETRGEGGLFLCAPSDGYELLRGDLREPPVVTADERDLLLTYAWELNEVRPPVVNGPSVQSSPHNGSLRPGDDYSHRGDVRRLLETHGWTLVRPGDNEYWRRPGKATGTSATLKDGVFYVFSTNAPPFEAETGYSPFAVYALLEHNGDFAAAASALATQGFGEQPDEAHGVDLSAFTVSGGCVGSVSSVMAPEQEDPVGIGCSARARIVAPRDPGALPLDALRVPGFIGEVMDHCLATAPYPNPTMAFCGALAMQAFLAGRKVRDPADNRTNIYLLGLAHSSAGKDWPRKINARVLHAAGLSNRLADQLASGEGIQDALFSMPSLLFQTDEIDGLLQSIKRARDARYESIMSTLLTMYSASNSIFPMRRRANSPDPGVIDQPCLVLFGTAIPNHYYAALSERMLTNGLLARMIVLESGPRGAGQEPRAPDPPERIIETASWWANFRPCPGNLTDPHPVPRTVAQTDGARRLLVEQREQAEASYAQAESRSDAVATTVWGRVSENTRKLALIYAVSESHREPEIGAEAVRWASRLVMHQTRRMLYMADGYAAEGEFDELALRLIRKLREARNRSLPHSVLLKRMKLDAKAFRQLVATLIERGDIARDIVSTSGRDATIYQLAEKEGEEGVNEERLK